MRMRRFTIRRAMVVMAAVAVAFAVCAERRSRFATAAEHHQAQIVEIYQVRPSHGPWQWYDASNKDLTEQEAAERIANNELHRFVAGMYREAACRPWLPLSIDPESLPWK